LPGRRRGSCASAEQARCPRHPAMSRLNEHRRRRMGRPARAGSAPVRVRRRPMRASMP
jgi:hypothetical protein